MRDAATTTAGTTFDPAAHGWKQMKLKGFTELVGPIWARRNGESWSYAFLAADRHDNRQGMVHGGMLVTFVDHALGYIAWEAAGRRTCVTMQLDTQFLAQVRTGDFVECETEIVRAAKSVVFLRGVLKVGGKAVMASNGIWKVLD